MLPNSKKHKGFLKMTNKNKILLAVLLVLMIAAIALAEVRINFKNQENGDETQKFSYHYYDDSLSYVDGTDNVTFSAYFMKDVKNNGNVRKVLSSLTEIGKSDTLYMQVNVRNEGYLKNGKIQINGKNFYLATNLYKDNEFKDNYIGINTKEIEFNNLPNGTSKDIEAEIRSGDYSLNSTMRDAVGDEDMLRNDNTIVFTGTYVDGEGNEIEINKEYELNVGWYGFLNAEIKDTYQEYSNISGMIDEENNCIKLRCKVTTEELNKQLAVSLNQTKIYLPVFNGYKALNANCLSSADYTKFHSEDEIGLLGINSTSGYLEIYRFEKSTYSENKDEFDMEKNTISKLSAINVYEIEVEYPLEAYKNLDSNVIDLEFIAETKYLGHNPNMVSNNRGYEWSESANKNIEVVYENIEKTDKSDIGIEIGKNGVSTKDIIDSYRGKASEDNVMNYLVTWKASIDESGLNKKIFMSDNAISDELVRKDLSKETTEDFVAYEAIKVNNAEKVLGEDGWIKVYDTETNSLIAMITKEKFDQEFYFDVLAKNIKIETSEVISVDMPLYVSCIKSLDVKKVIEKYTEDDFKEFNKISSNVEGKIGDKTIDAKIAIADLHAPISSLEVTTSEKNIVADGNEKNITLSLKTTEDLAMNKAGLINAEYLIKLPKEFRNVNITDLNIDNDTVTVYLCNVFEKDGYTFFRIITANESVKYAETYTLNVDMNLTLDTNKTVESAIEVYYTTEGDGYYEATTLDLYDANNNQNFDEYVGKKDANVKINYESEIYIKQSVENNEISPKYGDEEKNVNINVNVKNNEKSEVTGLKLVGRIPYKGNKYVVSEQDMGSAFSTTLDDAGIVIPEELKDKVTVYYSENVNAGVEIINSKNKWIKADEIENLDNIKAFMIDFGNTVIQPNEEYSFDYKVSVPGVEYLNKISYSGVAAYYTRIIEGETQKNQIESSKLGIRLAEKFEVDFTKYQYGTTVTVPGALYYFYDGNTGYIAKTDANGKINLNLYAGNSYYMVEIKSSEDYLKNSDLIWFEVKADENGELILTRSTYRPEFKFNQETRVLKFADADEIKGKIELSLVDKDTQLPISNAEFEFNNEFYKTDNNGKLTLRGIEKGKEYTITQIGANGYYSLNDIKFKIVLQNGKYSFVNISNNIKDSSLETVNGLIAHINLENEKVNKFNLQITAIGETDNISDESTYTYLPNVEFGLYENSKLIATYTTDQNGKLTIPNLCADVEGQENYTKYLLKELVISDGYSKLENMTICARKDGDGNLELSGDDKELYYTVNDNTINLILENYEYHKLINVDGYTGNVISGTKFMIMDAYSDEMAVKSDGTYWGQKENINGEEVYVGTTDENGEILLDLPEGQYKVVQVVGDGKYEFINDYFNVGLDNLLMSSKIEVPTKDLVVTSWLKKFDIRVSIDATNANAAATITNASEKVEYGATSTKEHKVIPKSGYEIVNVSINGVEQEITLNDEGSYTVPTFNNVTENKKIVVKIVDSNKRFTIKTVDAETKAPVEGVGIVQEKNLTENLIKNGNYYFIKNDANEYIPTNGRTYRSTQGSNRGISSSTANSYLVIDLTKETQNRKVVVKASCSSENNFDYGYATITNNSYSPSYNNVTGRFMYISGNVPESTYTSQTLYAGNKYYLHIGYRKDGSGDRDDDQVVIKDIQLDYLTGSANLDSDLTTNKLGKLDYQLNYGTYKFNIISLPEGYSVNNKEIMITHTVDSAKEITIELNRLKKVIVHHYLEGTTTKVADDEIFYGKLNEEYLVKDKKDLAGYELIKDVDGKYILPNNYRGTYAENDQEVNFYYKANKVEVVVHHYIEGTDTPVPLADGTLATDEKVEYDIGDEYKTSALSEDKLNKYYRLAYTDGEESGIVEKAKTEVTYYYTRPLQTLTITKYAEDGKTPLQGAEFTITSKAEYDNPVEIGEMNNIEIPEEADPEIADRLYCFEKDGDRYISTNHQKDSTSLGYMEIDLTNAASKNLIINAQMLGSIGVDRAAILVTLGTGQEYYMDEEFTAEPKDCVIRLEGGVFYTVSFIYMKNSAKADDLDDIFAINSIQLESAERIVTDENGKADISLRSNDYVVIEEKAPDGFERDSIPKNVEVNKDKPATLSVVNKIGTGKVIVHYYAEGTREKVAEDKVITGKIGNYYDTESLTKIGDSYELSGIPNNKYGYIKSEDTEVIYYYKANKFNLTINKTQKDSDIKLEGVKYEIINDNTVNVDVTDENGQINVSELELEKEYRLIEMSAPEGYSLIRNEIKFKLGYEDEKLVCKIENGDYESKIIYEETPRLEINIQNEPLFELTKTSEDGVKLLPGAKFVIKELVDNNGTIVENDAMDYAGNLVGTEENIDGQMLRVVTTDENGKIGIALKKGKYKVTEVQAPKGYTIGDDSTQYFEITDDTIKDVNFEEIFYHDALPAIDIDNGYVRLKDGSYISVGGYYDVLSIPGEFTADGEEILLEMPYYVAPNGYDSDEEGGYRNAYVMKINAEGKIEKADTFGRGSYFHITDIIATNDGGFAITGESQGNIRWNDDNLNINSEAYNDGIFTVKFNSDAKIEWVRTLGTYEENYMYNYQILEDNNGDYLVYGFTNGYIELDEDDVINDQEIELKENKSYLMKLRQDDGKIYWAKSIVGECYGKIAKADNDYLLHVIVEENEKEYEEYAEGVSEREALRPFIEYYPGEYIFRVSSSGIIKSVIPYEYTDFSDDFEYVTEQTAKDGGRLIIGNIRESFIIPADSTTSGKDINVKVFGKVTGVVLKTDIKGKIEWVRTLATDEGENMFLQVAATENNGCVVAGMFNGKLDVVYYDGNTPYVKTYETEENCINLMFLNYDSNGALLNVDGSRVLRDVGTDEAEENVSVESKFLEGIQPDYDIDFDVNSVNDLGNGYFEVCLMGYEYTAIPILGSDRITDLPGYYSAGKTVRNIVYKAVETPAKVAEKQKINIKNVAKAYTIKTRVEGSGGMITGEDDPVFEIVNQGEDSKKVIKIMPDRLHYIKKITINGVEIEFEINEEDGTYILKGFTDMDEDKEIVVTFGILNAEVVVHHYKEGTTEKIHEDVILNGKEDDPYSAEPVQELLKKYDVVETPKNATGEFAATKIEVNYYYRLKPETINVTVKYVDKSTGNEIADSETITGHKGDEYTTTEKEIKGFKLKEIPENAKGTMTENLEVIYYYSRPAKVIVNYIDTDTGDDLAEPEIIEGYQDDEYTTKAKEFEYYKVAKEPQNAKGTMEVKVSKDEDGEEVVEDETIVNYYYTKQAFNLKIKKDVSSAIVNGVSNDTYNGLSKIEIARKSVNTTNIQVVYKITVINDGDLAGKGTIQEQIPAGMEFVKDESSEWKVDGKTATLETKELAAGEQAEYTVTMNWTKSSENIGTKRNTVKLINTENEAGFEEKDTKDNTAYADIVIAISTGANSYMNIAGGILLVMIALACGVYVVKKVED